MPCELSVLAVTTLLACVLPCALLTHAQTFDLPLPTKPSQYTSGFTGGHVNPASSSSHNDLDLTLPASHAPVTAGDSADPFGLKSTQSQRDALGQDAVVARPKDDPQTELPPLLMKRLKLLKERDVFPKQSPKWNRVQIDLTKVDVRILELTKKGENAPGEVLQEEGLQSKLHQAVASIVYYRFRNRLEYCDCDDWVKNFCQDVWDDPQQKYPADKATKEQKIQYCEWSTNQWAPMVDPFNPDPHPPLLAESLEKPKVCIKLDRNGCVYKDINKVSVAELADAMALSTLPQAAVAVSVPTHASATNSWLLAAAALAVVFAVVAFTVRGYVQRASAYVSMDDAPEAAPLV